ncbi:MAG: hypothetical protein IMF12_04555 [Proteobacteria bacterium]|nr:hypothetical protein [Pseudomonadota bacterium]
MDVVHKRPKGTAGRNFRQHKNKFIQGEDYEMLTEKKLADFLVLFATTKNVFAKSDSINKIRSLIVLYEMGYLMSVKSFHDNLAWQVQRQLINVYFDHTKSSIQNNIAIDIADQFEACKRIAKTSGLIGNQAIISASKAVFKLTGYDPLELLDQKQLICEPQKIHLTPTAIGKIVGGLSAQKVNKILEKEGLQESFRDAKNKKCWKPTENGRPFIVLKDTSKKHKDGRPIQQMMWLESVISILEGPQGQLI